ncbi:terminase gpP N-terminus-related DNA-binding protein [Pediococcus acidilactici]|uniref:terminase gpP N-terminus-related DNA-binding protein n=1 Tax=Pediococcus acidilactici TaxID=1254 RepID=UPI001330FF8F|nr:helix-turn-helix domain-containing protein [Pediococcus acidilactici]KAF0381343.1 terminase [Pediococcus acidilactici]KAF0439604.1 terminase [Pediococcus acidilactici]KAF0544405.1 terminase [Pediococcus acidilactici]KAF0551395.1 terminase [Pediococcus acidilactici]
MGKQEQAEKDYLSGMKYKDIATKYDVSINTVKSWKKRYGWQRGSKKGAPPPEKRVHTKVKKGAHKNEGTNDELTPRQELFCQLVGAKRLPLYRAYMIAYEENEPSVSTAMANSSKLAKEEKVALRITKIQQEVAAKYEWSLDRVVGSLTFLHNEARADVIRYGVRKDNSDAMLNSLDRITNLLHISDEGKRAKAEADIAQSKADQLANDGDDNVTINFIRTNRSELHDDD